RDGRWSGVVGVEMVAPVVGGAEPCHRGCAGPGGRWPITSPILSTSAPSGVGSRAAPGVRRSAYASMSLAVRRTYAGVHRATRARVARSVGQAAPARADVHLPT